MTLLLAAILLVSCKNESRSYDFQKYADTANEPDINQGELAGVYTARLNPVTDIEFEDKELQKMQDLIDESRRDRSLKLLNEYSTPEERIDIGKVELKQEGSDRFKINVETVDEVTGETQALVFISNEDNDSDLIGFDLESGKNDHEVKTRGYCLDFEETVCRNLVIEISYDLNGRRLIRQYNFGRPPKKEVIPEEFQSGDVVEPEVATKPSDKIEQRAQVRPKARPANLVPNSSKTTVDDATIEAQTELEVGPLQQPEIDISEINTPKISNDRAPRIKKPAKLITPSVERELPNIDGESLSLEEADERKTLNDSLGETLGSENSQLETKTEVTTGSLEAPKVDDRSTVASNPNTESNPRMVAPSKLAVPSLNEDSLPKVDQSPAETPDTGLRTSLRPKKRPNNLSSSEAPKVSKRPVERPESKGFDLIEEPKEIDSEETALSPGVYVLPDSDDKKPLHFRDLGIESESYGALDEDQTTTENSKFGELLNSLKTNKYNQSKGGYGGRLGSGWIKESSALSNADNDSVEPRVSSKKYGSGLTIDFLTWMGKEYLSKYRNDSICVNHISAKSGGEIGHRSHENGLDIDMSIPSSNHDCKKRGLKDYRNYYKGDRDFFKKNYDLVKSMISSGKVHVIFVDRSYITRMCDYTKTLDLSNEEKEERKKVFQKLWHVGGHANHFHVRMVCNEQNLGCKSQGRLSPNVSTSCD